MKSIGILVLALIALTQSFNASAASSVRVIIDGESYSCSKGGANENQDCTLIKGGNTDKYGTRCENFSDRYCAFLYEFGTLTKRFESIDASSGADWCREQLRR